MKYGKLYFTIFCLGLTVVFLSTGQLNYSYEPPSNSFWDGFISEWLLFYSWLFGFWLDDLIVANSGGQMYNFGFFCYIIILCMYNQYLGEKLAYTRHRLFK